MKKDHELAFPTKWHNSSDFNNFAPDGSVVPPGETVYQSGMSLRDYFAAKAMAAMITTAASPCLVGLQGCDSATAVAAYKIADAMLVERKKVTG
jgi:hypothetical protein